MNWAPLRIVAGLLLVALGLVGALLPVVQGWMFLIPGLALLSRHFHWARRLRAVARAARAKWRRRKPRRGLPANPSQ